MPRSPEDILARVKSDGNLSVYKDGELIALFVGGNSVTPKKYFNPWHDEKGRFDFGPDGVAGPEPAGAGRRERGHLRKEDLEKMTEEERWKMLAKDCGVSDEEARAMYWSIKMYTENYYFDIRLLQQQGREAVLKKYLDTGEFNPGEAEMWVQDVEKYEASIEKFLAKAPPYPEDTIYRIVSLDGSPEGLGVGSVIDQKGTSSWTTGRDIAIAKMKVGGPGTPVLYVSQNRSGCSTQPYSTFYSESEVTHSMGTKWTITGKEEKIAFGTGVKYYEVSLEEIQEPKKFFNPWHDEKGRFDFGPDGGRDEEDRRGDQESGRHYGASGAPQFVENLRKYCPEEFISYLTPYTPGQYIESGTRLFLAPDGKSGFAIKPDGDIISVFSAGGGRLGGMIERAILEGGTKLDCLGGGLRDKYMKYGFRVTSTEKWNKEYKPENWDYKRHDSPNVWYMKLDEEGARKMGKDVFLSPEELRAAEEEELRNMTREQIINMFRSVKLLGEEVDTVKLEGVLKRLGK